MATDRHVPCLQVSRISSHATFAVLVRVASFAFVFVFVFVFAFGIGLDLGLGLGLSLGPIKCASTCSFKIKGQHYLTSNYAF